MQRSPLPSGGNLLVCGSGRTERLVGNDLDEGIYLFVISLNTGKARLDHLG